MNKELEVAGVDKIKEKLTAANLTLVEQLKGLSSKDLESVDGIGAKSAEEIVAAMKKVK